MGIEFPFASILTVGLLLFTIIHNSIALTWLELGQNWNNFFTVFVYLLHRHSHRCSTHFGISLRIGHFSWCKCIPSMGFWLKSHLNCLPKAIVPSVNISRTNPHSFGIRLIRNSNPKLSYRMDVLIILTKWYAPDSAHLSQVRPQLAMFLCTKCIALCKH